MVGGHNYDVFDFVGSTCNTAPNMILLKTYHI